MQIRFPYLSGSVLLGLSSLPFAVQAAGETERYFLHQANTGDSLARIAKRYLVKENDWALLKADNRIADPNRIPLGTKIRIPVSKMRTELAAARITAVTGAVTANTEKAGVGVMLKEGDRISTADNAFVTIQLADGSTLTVQSKSAVRFEVARQFVNAGGVYDSVVRLDAGRLETHAAKQNGPAARYEIRTPTSNMGVRGTAFRVGADATGSKGQSEVTEGLVAVAGAESTKGELGLPAGFGTIVEAGKAPLPPIALLPPPELKSPSAAFSTAHVQFSFAALQGATAYRGQVATDAAFTKLISNFDSKTPVMSFAGLPDGALYFRARGIDRQGLEGRDAGYRFVVDARPFAPALLLPAAGARTTIARVNASWSPVAEAKSYRLQLARDNNFANGLIERESAGLPAATVHLDKPSGMFWWRVASIDGSGKAGPWSDARSFEIDAAVPVLKPKYGQRQIALELDPSESQLFQVQVSRNDKFTSTVFDRTVGGREIELGNLAQDVYYVRMRAVTKAPGKLEIATGPWSATGMLEVFTNEWWLSAYRAAAR